MKIKSTLENAGGGGINLVLSTFLTPLSYWNGGVIYD